MSSLCFIWKSILECLQMQPPLSSRFHIVFHSEPVRVYTETHVDWYGSAAAIVQRRVEKCLVTELYKQRERGKRFCRQESTALGPFSPCFSPCEITCETTSHTVRQKTESWDRVQSRQTCDCDNSYIWNSFHLKSDCGQLEPPIHKNYCHLTSLR